MTAREFAKKMGVDVSTVHVWIRKKRLPGGVSVDGEASRRLLRVPVALRLLKEDV